MKNPASVGPLSEAVDVGATDSTTHLVNKELAAALGEIGDPKAAPALLRLLKARDNFTRVEAMVALGRMRVGEAVEPLIQMATDEEVEPFLNKKAIEALGRIGDARAVPVLVRMLTKERRGVSFYVESSFALFQVGPPAADALVRQLSFKHEDERIQAMARMQAADALARMRSAEAVKPLAAMVGEPDPTVRQAYTHALVRLGGREALPMMEKAANQGHWEAREAAI